MSISQWCHPTTSFSVVPFSSCLHSFPASGSFQMSQFFASGGKVLELQIQHQSFQWIFRTDFLYDGLVGSPCSPRDSQESSPTPQFKSINSWHSAFFIVQLSHPYMWENGWNFLFSTGKTIALIRWTFVGKVMSLLFNMLSRLIITFYLRNKHLLISWLLSPSAVIWEPKKIVCHCFHCFPIYWPWSDGTGCHVLSFLNVEL